MRRNKGCCCYKHGSEEGGPDVNGDESESDSDSDDEDDITVATETEDEVKNKHCC